MRNLLININKEVGIIWNKSPSHQSLLVKYQREGLSIKKYIFKHRKTMWLKKVWTSGDIYLCCSYTPSRVIIKSIFQTYESTQWALVK